MGDAPPAKSTRLEDAASNLLLSALYICSIELLAYVFLHDRNEKIAPDFVAQLHNWVKSPASVPALCRWDCVWYMNIATGTYPGKEGSSAYNTAFFPLFGLAIRAVSALTRLPAGDADLWINRACLPVSVGLLREFVHRSGGNREAGWAAVTALLFAPYGFILVSGYAEGFFFVLTLATAVLLKRGVPYWAMVPAFMAGLTRVHAFAFLAGLGVFGLVQFWKSQRRLADARWLAPAVACGAAILGLIAYFDRVAHDPLLFIHQQKWFGKPTFNALGAIRELVTYWHLFPPTSIGAFIDWIRLPVAVVLAGSLGYFIWQRRWFEAGYVGALNTMILLSTYWGAGRYAVLVFPVSIAVSKLRRWPPVWIGYLFYGAILQAYLLLEFVLLRRFD